jgi:hypothetical protein
MIELTEQQRQELSTSGAVVIDSETREEYVLMRRAAYERLRALVEGGTVLATGELVDRLMAEDDANDPTLASYQPITRKS